jgi:hypothetical protein
MIGRGPGASTASAAAMAGPQVRLGGWNCAVSQMTAGEATAEGDGGGDEDDPAAQPAPTIATIVTEITNLLMAPQTVRHPRRFPCARASRGLVITGALHDERLLP